MSIFKILKSLYVKMYICIKLAHFFQVFLAGKLPLFKCNFMPIDRTTLVKKLVHGMLWSHLPESHGEIPGKGLFSQSLKAYCKYLEVLLTRVFNKQGII